MDSSEQIDPLTLLVPFVKSHATKGDAASVVAAMDTFGWTKSWMMFIGDRKGALLDDTVHRLRPGARVLELGCVCVSRGVQHLAVCGVERERVGGEPAACDCNFVCACLVGPTMHVHCFTTGRFAGTLQYELPCN